MNLLGNNFKEFLDSKNVKTESIIAPRSRLNNSYTLYQSMVYKEIEKEANGKKMTFTVNILYLGNKWKLSSKLKA